MTNEIGEEQEKESQGMFVLAHGGKPLLDFQKGGPFFWLMCPT